MHMTRMIRIILSRKRVREECRTAVYDLPAADEDSVLDLLERIRRDLDDSLMYRHSCHHGSCGTCACIVNGEERLACTTKIEDLEREGKLHDDTIRIEPLAGLKRIGDIALDPSGFFGDFPVDFTYLRPSEANRGAKPPEEVEKFVRFENCIECGCCVSVCPVSVGFIGPAALARYNREREKNPDRAKKVLDETDAPGMVWACERALDCSRVCPTGVYPAKHIQQLRNAIKHDVS